DPRRRVTHQRRFEAVATPRHEPFAHLRRGEPLRSPYAWGFADLQRLFGGYPSLDIDAFLEPPPAVRFAGCSAANLRGAVAVPGEREQLPAPLDRAQLRCLLEQLHRLRPGMAGPRPSSAESGERA